MTSETYNEGIALLGARPRSPHAPVIVDPTFNGPVGYANGGYISGRLAALVDGPARVVLRRPVPLKRPIAVSADGEALVASRRGRVIAEVSPLAPGTTHEDPPIRPTLLDLERASQNHPFIGQIHPLSYCYVCSPTRAGGLRVTPGPLTGNREFLGAVFRVPSMESVPTELVWAALDCPSYPAEAMRTVRLCLLGTIEVIQHRPVLGGEVLGIVSWTRYKTARTYGTSAALLDADGEVVASAQSIWVAVRNRWRMKRARSLRLSS